jgi:hypothetical protein
MQNRAPAGFSAAHAEQSTIGAQLETRERIADIAASITDPRHTVHAAWSPMPVTALACEILAG